MGNNYKKKQNKNPNSKKKKMNFIIRKDQEELKIFDISPSYAEICSEIKQNFGLKNGTFKVSYIDVEGDPIAIEDDDDLEVCMFEFSEMSKIDEPVNLIIEESHKVLKKKSSFKSIKIENNKEDMKAINMDDDASQISEKVVSILDSKISELIDTKISSLNDTLAMTIERAIAAKFTAIEQEKKKKEKIQKEKLAKLKAEAEKVNAKKAAEKKAKKEQLLKIQAEKKAKKEAEEIEVEKKKSASPKRAQKEAPKKKSASPKKAQ